MNVSMPLRIAILALALGGAPHGDLDPRLRGEQEVAPAEALRLAVMAEDCQELLPEMLRVCRRESGCGRWGPVGIHKADAGAGKLAWHRARRKGWLHPEQCPSHHGGEPWGRFSTRGIMGIRAAWAVHLLEPELGPCVAPEVLDHPGPAALAAVRWAKACRVLQIRKTHRGWVPMYVEGCTCKDRARRWAGAGRFDSWTFSRQRQSVERQCGPQPKLALWQELSDVVQLTLAGMKTLWAIWWQPPQRIRL